VSALFKPLMKLTDRFATDIKLEDYGPTSKKSEAWSPASSR